jgi:hypothetical protein
MPAAAGIPRKEDGIGGPLLIMLNVVTNQMIPRTHAARLDSIQRERKVRL